MTGQEVLRTALDILRQARLDIATVLLVVVLVVVLVLVIIRLLDA